MNGEPLVFVVAMAVGMLAHDFIAGR
jgi:hypothetical protein